MLLVSLVLLGACGGTQAPTLVGDGGTSATTGGTSGTATGGATGGTTTGGNTGGTGGDVAGACTNFCIFLLECMDLSSGSGNCGTACQADPTGAFTNNGVTCTNYAGVYDCLAGLPCSALNGDAGLDAELALTACFTQNGCQ